MSPISEAVIAEVRGVTKHYGRGKGSTDAVVSANLEMRRGEIVGIAGRSGSGKSTLLRVIAGIELPTTGVALLGGRPAVERAHSGFVMPIFQDPVSSLDPRWPIWRSITEPMTAPHRRTRPNVDERKRIARDQLPRVGLLSIDIEARPGNLSGGQCQRVSILRALTAEPDLLVADEPTSALDPSIAAGILHLLRDAASRGTAIAIVSHDRNALAVLCDRVLEMRDGVLGAN